jgi:hypothetical protein
MPDNDAVGTRGRTPEDEYFWRRDRELVEKMRRAAAAESARRDMSAKTGLDDPEMLDDLHALGFTPDTLSLLPLVPMIEIAWAEGGVTHAERVLLIQLARDRGVMEGSAADRQLADWLTNSPDAQVFARATRLIRAMLAAPAQEHGALSADDIVNYCERIATASGGMLGIKRISTDERALLATIAADLRKRHL